MSQINVRMFGRFAAILIVVTGGIALRSVTASDTDPPPGIGTYKAKRCLDGISGSEPTVHCTFWDPSWCASTGQECNGCFPDAANSKHQTCKGSNNPLDGCKSSGSGPFCGQKELRRCTSDGNGGWHCVWHADIDGQFCSRWKCDNVPVPTPQPSPQPAP